MPKKIRTIDRKWRRRLRNLKAAKLKNIEEGTPTLLIDHERRSLHIQTAKNVKKLALINSHKIRNKLFALNLLKKRLKKREKNELIRDYYLQVIEDYKIDLKSQRIKYLSDLNETEKNKQKHLLNIQRNPLPDENERATFINEFLAFCRYLAKHNEFDIQSFPHLAEITSSDFYLVADQKLELDFKPAIENFKLHIINEPTQRYNAQEIKKIFEKFLEKIHLHSELKVAFNNKYLFSVDSNNIYIPKSANITKNRIIQLINHEILGHALRSVMGRKNISSQNQRLALLKSGNSKNTTIEEGIGSFLEQNALYPSSKHDVLMLFHFYLRMITIHLALQEEPYVVYEKLELLKRFHAFILNEPESVQVKNRNALLLRVYRGFENPTKGCINSRIGHYLKGNRQIWEFIEEGENFANLYAGKIQPNQIATLKEMGFQIPETFLGSKEYPREYILQMIEECFSA